MDEEKALKEVEGRPWYRVLGYRSAYQLVLLAGVLAFMLVRKAIARELGSLEGLVLLGIAAGVVAIAIWDYSDWRKEKRAAREAVERGQQRRAT